MKFKFLSKQKRPRSGELPKVYDTFIFYNELTILEIRLNELANVKTKKKSFSNKNLPFEKVVDQFILVESDKTFTFKDKPLHFKGFLKYFIF